MNQPTIEQFNELRKKYFELESKVERLDELEKKRDFIIRDSAVKIGISEGLATKTHEGLNKLEREMFQLRAEMKELRENSEQHFEIIHKKLDKQEIIIKDNSARLANLEATTKDNSARLANLEATTKDNSARLANLEAGQQRQEQMLREILDRLPPKQ